MFLNRAILYKILENTLSSIRECLNGRPEECNVISKGFIIPCPSRKLHACNKEQAINIQCPTIGLLSTDTFYISST